MSLTVLSVAFPLAPVGPDAVGGAEQVLSALDHALAAAGHRSIVLAAGGSVTAGEFVQGVRIGEDLGESYRHFAHETTRRKIEDILFNTQVDLIHFHGVDFNKYFVTLGRPAVVTLHLPPLWYPPEIFQWQKPDLQYVAVSEHQRAHCPPGPIPLECIPNGVDGSYCSPHARRNFALCLGRICPEKGYHLALEAAKLAETPLLLAGHVFGYAAHQAYFKMQILPCLDRQRKFIGPAGLQRKRRLLSAARCLVVPSLAPETSSLVAMEAMACGTPVIAFNAGAIGEIVEHGKTGYIVQDKLEMAEAIRMAHCIDPEACRRRAREHFSIQRMAADYLRLWQRAAGKERLDTNYGNNIAAARQV
jgi:glycosyltransferase involved in cell wall biosynthesis